MSAAQVHFGGPDRPAGALRDLLQARVDAVAAGDSIDWMTYYFRDERLAEALVRAHGRGVAVRVCVEGRPRHRGANDAVVRLLRRGIGEGLRVVERWFGASHLHTKLYCFGGQLPHVLLGSFNPSGNGHEDPAIVSDIGDQDRGHNLLVELTDPAIVAALTAHVAVIHGGGRPAQAPVSSGSTLAYLFPRSGINPLDQRLGGLGRGAKLRIAASHFGDPHVARQLVRIASLGGDVQVLTHHTRRRSPERLVSALRAAGVRTCRYEHPDQYPMHAKFVLAERDGERWCAFGSYNLSRTSRWLNQELLVFSGDDGLWSTLDGRWDAITSEPWCKG